MKYVKSTRTRARKHKRSTKRTRTRRGGNPLMAIRLFGKAKKHYDSKKQSQVVEEEEKI
jgi:hypothetical protein